MFEHPSGEDSHHFRSQPQSLLVEGGRDVLNEIERIADYRRTDAALKSALDAVSNSLLDSLRALADDKIEQAIAANGTQWKIARAQIALRLGDRDRGRDWLKGAANDYGYAWRWANSAY